MVADGDGSGEDAWRRQHLARSLQLPLWREPAPAPELLLDYVGSMLALRQPPPARTGKVGVEFSAGPLQRRLQGADLLLRAVRGRRREPLRIIDATAGLGRDSYHLAARGFSVLMIERAPVIGALLRDGLERGCSDADPEVRSACLRLCLEIGEARQILPRYAGWDVVYLDPMFPDRSGQALAKKEMHWLQQLLADGEGEDEAELLAAARSTAALRVVVKRPRRAPPFAGTPADYQVMGRTIRFDVYHPS